MVIEAPNVVASQYIGFRTSESPTGNKPYFYMEYTEAILGSKKG